jgi:hypothetical protein
LIFIHANYTKQSSLFTKSISSITKIPAISFSTSPYEPRIRLYKDFSTVIYPEQKKLSYMDFVYEN